MRITLSLDDDVFGFACAHALGEHVSIDEAISRVAREGIPAQVKAAAKTVPLKSKFALLPARDEVITSKHVRDLMGQAGN
jgi:hypothetical protein